MKTIAAVISLILALGPAAMAAAPQRVLYQGTLRRSGALFTGNATFVFRVTDLNGTTQYWTSGSTVVAVNSGLFRYPLGITNTGSDGGFPSVSWASIDPYVEVTVDGTLLVPREPMVSVPYALYNLNIANVNKYGDSMLGPLTMWASSVTVVNHVSTAAFSLAVTTATDRSVYHLYVATTGMVGIATTNIPALESILVVADPTNPAVDYAHVRYLGGSGGQLSLENWSNGWNVNVRTPGENLYLNRDSDATGDLYLGRSAAGAGFTTILKGDSGSVGIGTTNPAARLEVKPVAADPYSLFVSSQNGSLLLGVDKAGDVYVGPHGHSLAAGDLSNNPDLLVGGNVIVDGQFISHNGIGSSVAFTSAGDFVVGTSTLVVTQGRVGIGTTNPQTVLDVMGQFTAQDGTRRFQAYGSASQNVVYAGAWSNHDLALTSNNSEVLRIKTGGNVGIGTTNPGAKLNVAGNAFIDTSGGSAATRHVTIKSGGTQINWGNYPGQWSPSLMLQGVTAAGGAESATDFLFMSALQETTPARITASKGLEAYTGASVSPASEGNLALAIDVYGRTSVGGASSPPDATRFWVQGSTVDAYHLKISSQNGSTTLFAVDTKGDVFIGPHAHSLTNDLSSAQDLAVTGNVIVDGQFISHNGIGSSVTFTSAGDFVVGTSTLVVTQGKLGLGTASPDAQFDVERPAPDAAFTETIRLTNPNSTAGGRNTIDWFNSAGNMKSARLYSQVGAAYNASKFFVDVADTSQVLQQRLTIDQDGDLGVGTTDPAARLHVNGNAFIDTSGTSAATRHVTLKSGGAQFSWGNYAGNWSPSLMMQGVTPGGAESATNFLFMSALDDTQPARMTSSKGMELYTGAVVSPASSGNLALAFDSTGRLSVGGAAAPASTRLWVQGATADDFHLRVSSQNATGSLLVVDKAGNVGIGTVGPGEKLDIAGNARLNSGLYRLKLVPDNFAPAFTSANPSQGVALETGDGSGGGNAWIWKEKFAASNWGIYHDNTADQVQFIGNSLGLMVVDFNDGKVGIGTTGPATKLHVDGVITSSGTGAGTGGEIDFHDGSVAGTVGVIYTGNDELTIAAQNNRGIRFDDDTTTRMFIQDGGNVGIGTTNPSKHLSIEVPSAATDGLIVRRAGGAGNRAELRVDGASNYGALEMMDDTGTSNVYLKASGDSYLKGGNVGIGTTNPGASLDVAGNIRVGTTAQTGAANRFRMLQSMVRVTKTGAQTLTNNTATAISWDAEAFDTDGLHDNVTNNTRLTAAVTGKYLVGATIVYTENLVGGRGVHVRKNGTTYYGGNEPQTPAAGGTFHDGFSHTTMVDLAAGDYVEIMGHQQSGGNLDILNASNPITQAWMTYIGE